MTKFCCENSRDKEKVSGSCLDLEKQRFSNVKLWSLKL